MNIINNPMNSNKVNVIERIEFGQSEFRQLSPLSDKKKTDFKS